MELISIAPWLITCEAASEETRDYRESVFSQGNGYLGLRGYRPDETAPNKAHRTTFFSGFYEYIRPGITDLVNQPDCSYTEITILGQPAGELRMLEATQSLSLKTGEASWRYTLEDDEGHRTRVEAFRFANMDNRHLIGQRYQITPLNYDGSVELTTGVDGGVENLPISDNQMQGNTEFVKFWTEHAFLPREDGGVLSAKTRYSMRETAAGWRVRASGAATEQTAVSGAECCSTRLTASLFAGQTWQVDKLSAVACYRDGIDPVAQASRLLDDNEADYDALLRKNASAWESIWNTADIRLDASDELQGAVRYNIYQLIASAPHGDEHASIGARGLMHGRYKGCYFWDTEVFMLPFFRDTLPKTAKSLLMYRYHTLADARESARRFSVKGARYSWMSSDTGFEQCETWDTGCCEIHITADIAYAVGAYASLSGDMAFLDEFGAEILVETARYWFDRFSYNSAEDRYHLLFVKGPDEYCGVTSDNFYTVRLAKHNISLALSTLERLKREDGLRYEALIQATALLPQETANWLDLLQKTAERFDESRNLWVQDATFEQLEPLEIQSVRSGSKPLYYTLNFDRLQRYRVLKQPDVLMLMALLPETFSNAEVEAAWRYYEPITLHDSTLSFGIHALVAARLGKQAEANEYFDKAVYMDLKDVMQNTAREGIHTAALGAAWQALVYGFCGLSTEPGVPRCSPRLPESIRSAAFTVFRDGSWYDVTVSRDGACSVSKIEDTSRNSVFLPRV
ncbi:MAG TPA: hypothetical protein VN453_07105 [Feifaniaceae bacterium]|nr:hypothetical protein [Feifaniaceae bacterium]